MQQLCSYSNQQRNSVGTWLCLDYIQEMWWTRLIPALELLCIVQL